MKALEAPDFFWDWWPLWNEEDDPGGIDDVEKLKRIEEEWAYLIEYLLLGGKMMDGEWECVDDIGSDAKVVRHISTDRVFAVRRERREKCEYCSYEDHDPTGYWLMEVKPMPSIDYVPIDEEREVQVAHMGERTYG